MKRWLALVNQDPGLCADLLHLANTFSIRPEGHDDTVEEAVLRHHCPLFDDDFNYLAAIIFTAHFVACSDFTGETLSSMLPDELLGRLNLTAENFNKTQQIYFSRKEK